MALVLNTNIAALNASRNLATTQNQQATTFQRLSTGLRVNSAKDDAAGLYLAQSQTKDIRGLNMATRNASDGISMAQTAEGALDQVAANLQRINELAIQAANGTYDSAARGGLQKEVDQLTQEIKRIVETTEFNGEPLLSKEATSKIMQIGFRDNANSQISTGLENGIHGTLNLDADIQQFVINGSSKAFALDTNDSDDFNNGISKNADVLTEANKNLAETFGVEVNAAGNGFEIGETLATSLANAIADADTSVGVGGTEQRTITQGGMTFIVTVEGGATASDPNTWTVAGTYSDGTSISLPTGITAGTVGTNSAATDFEVLAIGGVGEPLEALTEVRVYPENALADIVRSGLNGTLIIDISTQTGAQVAITQTRNAIDFISEQRATFGAVMNRFEAVISGNNIYAENLSAARSRIQDADFAVESSNLAKQQVLQQAGISSLAQANQSSQAILNLL